MRNKQKNFRCTLCGKSRRVRTFPVSNCHCVPGWPSKYMSWDWIIKDSLSMITINIKWRIHGKWYLEE